MPDELRSQIEPIHEAVRLLGWTVLDVPGVEADDVIGTLAVTAARQGVAVVVSSSDKDLAQLVDEHITIIDTLGQKRRDMAGVEAEFGVPARLMLDYQTLVGDAVDNVPGVPKVGPKTAVKWLQEYGSLEAIVANAAQIKGVVGENLRKSLDWLPTGRSLLTIKTDCELQAFIPGLPALDALVMQAQDTPALLGFCERFGFKGFAKSLLAAADKGAVDAPADSTKAKPGAAAGIPSGLFDAAETLANPPATAPRSANAAFETILTWDALDSWLERINSAELTALDTETNSLDEMRAEVVGISFSVAPGQAAYLPLAHNYPDAPAQLPRQQVLERLKPWLENPAAQKLGQHIKYDRHVFANHGIEVR
ncbi:MAG: DNA polymerase I, partial [Rhodoferax sp.]|nr:DNA polymerase I [Rhodoferax sp.]